MFGLNRMSGIGKRDADLGAPRVGIENVADEQDLALEDLVRIGREHHVDRLALGDQRGVLFRDARGDPDRLRSAMVISAAVVSFQYAPGATARSITLPAIGAVIVTVRDLLVVSASTPICLSLRQRALLLDLRGDVVGFRLLQILDRAAPDLGETALAVARLGGERKDHFGAVIVGIGGREIGRIEDD